MKRSFLSNSWLAIFAGTGVLLLVLWIGQEEKGPQSDLDSERKALTGFRFHWEESREWVYSLSLSLRQKISTQNLSPISGEMRIVGQLVLRSYEELDDLAHLSLSLKKLRQYLPYYAPVYDPPWLLHRVVLGQNHCSASMRENAVSNCATSKSHSSSGARSCQLRVTRGPCGSY